MIDTHAHLYAEEFDEDRDAVLARAKEAGIQQVLLPNIDETTIDRLNSLAKSSDICVPMMGLHPCYVKENYKEQLQTIKKEFTKNDYIAVGEIGIDLYWDKTTQPYQEAAFLEQCKWAEEMKLPIAIHSRESTDLIIELIKRNSFQELTGVFHCFGGSKEQAKEIIDMGFLLGIGGVVTFKNSTLREELKDISLDKIIVETDSPYLAPVPYRGKRNETSYIIEVVKQLSYVFDVPEQEIKKRTTENALALFKL
ncbi:MAG: TatD family hydrolase [Bacteroidia bacterium]|jgi:TatD DNase family protein|tara:strand:- start:3362 stop:4120 length:759 start_codon:yes stop_codon:yes gene_type:complete